MNGLLCGDVPVCGHPSEEAPDCFFGGEVLRHAGTRVIQGVVISIGNGFGLAGIFSGVLYRGVVIEDGLQVDLGPPSKQDRFEFVIEPRVLASARKVLT